jgi:hypothetical protein
LVDVNAQISAIVAVRHEQLPVIRERIDQWLRLDQQLAVLTVALAEAGERSIDRFTEARVSEARSSVAEMLERLRALEARFARSTVNVGVSGSARVGKSTVLQSITGLGDEQIPTGTGIPVTAVRSRIYHADHSRALVSLHTFDTFRRDVLEPLHLALTLAAVPAGVDEFRTWPYPATIEEHLGADAESAELAAQLTRLREIQQALPTFADDLTGGDREVPLADLRQYVAYPNAGERAAPGGARHRYLAVREVMIECPFPAAAVSRLGLVDLPGLGEADTNSDARHVANLRGDVDVVVMVLRPAEGIAYFGRPNIRTLELLKEVRGRAGSARDFVFLAVNDAAADRERLPGLRQSILQLANDNEPDKRFQVLTADAKDAGQVHDRIVAPVLGHLVERLPAMDREVRALALAEAKPVLERIGTTAAEIGTALRRSRPAQGVDGMLIGRARELRSQLALELRVILDDLRRQAEETAEDEEFVHTLETTFDEILEWIKGGFDEGTASWTKRAYLEMARADNASGFAAEELNYTRVDISRRFAALSDLFVVRVNAVWAAVATALRRNLGDLLGDREPSPENAEAVLRRLSGLLEEAEEPCPTLASAITGLLEVRIDYQSQLYPRVRSALSGLNQEVPNPATGEIVHQTSVPVSEQGAEQLLSAVSRLAEGAAHQAKRALLADSMAPSAVLFAAVEHFADLLIRSRESDSEFRQLARSYRDDIWPAEFHTIGQASARLNRLRNAVRSVSETVADLERAQ